MKEGEIVHCGVSGKECCCRQFMETFVIFGICAVSVLATKPSYHTLGYLLMLEETSLEFSKNGCNCLARF